MFSLILKSQHQNVWICAYSIALLNYNCAITPYVLYLRNEEFFSASVSEQAFATLSVVIGIFFGQIFLGTLGDQIGRRKSFFLSLIFLLAGSLLSLLTSESSSHSLTTPMVFFGISRFFVGLV